MCAGTFSFNEHVALTVSADCLIKNAKQRCHKSEFHDHAGRLSSLKGDGCHICQLSIDGKFDIDEPDTYEIPRQPHRVDLI